MDPHRSIHQLVQRDGLQLRLGHVVGEPCRAAVTRPCDVLGLTLSGTVTFGGTNPPPASGITVGVTGSNINPRTVMTGADGRYSVELPAGTYQVSLDSKLPSHAGRSADCGAKDQVCTVTLDHNRSADFVIDCATDTVDFKTSMIATGCFVPGDTPNKLKAKGSFR